MSGIAGGMARREYIDTDRAEKRLAIQKLGQERLGGGSGLPNLGDDVLDRINQYQIAMGTQFAGRREHRRLEDAKRAGEVEPFQDQGTKTMMNALERMMGGGGGAVRGTNARGGATGQ